MTLANIEVRQHVIVDHAILGTEPSDPRSLSLKSNSRLVGLGDPSGLLILPLGNEFRRREPYDLEFFAI